MKGLMNNTYMNLTKLNMNPNDLVTLLKYRFRCSSLGRDLGRCLSNKLAGAGDAPGWETILGEVRYCSTSSQPWLHLEPTREGASNKH